MFPHNVHYETVSRIFTPKLCLNFYHVSSLVLKILNTNPSKQKLKHNKAYTYLAHLN